MASDLIGHGFSAALRARPSAEVWQGKLTAYGRDYMTAGAAEIQRRLAALPPAKHSLTLRMLLAEIEGHQFGH
ncbi:MAG: hypothetical protein ACRDOD_07275 [Streptosporangiaceae bacterium]